MIETSQEWVVERLAQLETENRRLARKVRWMARVGAVSLLGVFVSVACGAAMLANPDIKPGFIGVSDPGGSNIAIGLEATNLGSSVIFFDNAGKKAMALASGPAGQGLFFFDNNGKQINKIP